MEHFTYDALGRLRAESVDLAGLADVVGTPTFVYAEADITRQYEAFDNAFASHPHLICYAVKANANGAVLARLGSLGSGADIVSGGELMLALRAGIPAHKIVFSGVGKTREEMAAALDVGILAFNVESAPELELLDEVARAKNKVASISLRVNPDVDAQTHPYIATGLKESKFGVPIGDAPRLAAQVRDRAGLRLVGVDCHIGSQLTTIEPFLEALDSVLALVDRLKSEGHDLHEIDLGGGLGITYSNETPPSPDQLARAVLTRLDGRPERLILEPGRVIVGNAGVLLTRVLYVKETGDRTFVITDAGMNDLIRPALYEAHHDIWPVLRRAGATRKVVDVVGPVCETGDWFAHDREMDSVVAGDLLAIKSAGAYGFSMSSTYNSRPRAAEVLVSRDRHHVVRARETLASLADGESLPSWFEKKRS